MSRQIYIGLTTEGTTDVRFLSSVVQRTFEDIAFNECAQDIDISTFIINVSKIGLDFCDYIKKASFEGVNKYGIMTLVVHTDSDRNTYDERMNNKIIPAQDQLNLLDENYCKLLTPIIPVKMIESWMLADKELLKRQIGTTKSDSELGIDRRPETIADPKTAIENAIRIANEDFPRRRKKLTISELYGIIGDSVNLESLKKLDSYKKFQDSVRNTYIKLGYMYYCGK